MSNIGFPTTATVNTYGGQPTDFVAQPTTVTEAATQQKAVVPDDVGVKPLTLDQGNLQASFEYDQSLKQIIIILRRAENGEVVQQLPSEQIMNMLRGMMDSLGNALDVKG